MFNFISWRILSPGMRSLLYNKIYKENRVCFTFKLRDSELSFYKYHPVNPGQTCRGIRQRKTCPYQLLWLPHRAHDCHCPPPLPGGAGAPGHKTGRHCPWPFLIVASPQGNLTVSSHWNLPLPITRNRELLWRLYTSQSLFHGRLLEPIPISLKSPLLPYWGSLSNLVPTWPQS